jgi:hippurate hydrolase
VTAPAQTQGATPPAGASVPAALRPLFSGSLAGGLVQLRRALHQHPELSLAETETARRLAAALTDVAGLPRADVRLIGTAVIGRVRGRQPGAPVVALRGDIDALPIQESTGLPFASQVPGVMHACGHDVHATWAVGAAALLAAAPAAGDVVIVLQPAEEIDRGAAAVLDAGVLDGVVAIFGGHVDRRFAVGQVVADDGPLAASADTFTIELVGRGAHAARPQESADPVVGAGALIVAAQAIVARRVHPATPAVLTIATVHAGTANNIIPARAVLTGTIRTVDPATRQLVREELERIAGGIATAYRLEARITVELGPPPLVNPHQPAEWARQAVRTVLGDGALVPLGIVNLAAEDFARYLERMPGCFLRIGAREAGGEPIAAHSPHFTAAEESIFVGAAVLAETARVSSHAHCDRHTRPK